MVIFCHKVIHVTEWTLVMNKTFVCLVCSVCLGILWSGILLFTNLVSQIKRLRRDRVKVSFFKCDVAILSFVTIQPPIKAKCVKSFIGLDPGWFYRTVGPHKNYLLKLILFTFFFSAVLELQKIWILNSQDIN